MISANTSSGIPAFLGGNSIFPVDEEGSEELEFVN